jgi:hypothetical protein
MHVSDLDFGSGCASLGTMSFAPEKAAELLARTLVLDA